jgi:uncharacterized protein
MRERGIFLLVFLVFIVSVSAVELPNYKDKYVNDFANVLSTGEVGYLRALFYEVDMNTSAEVVFVSDSECTSKGGQSQYAIDLGKYWKVGKEDKDNGLLILYCKAENKIFAATGYGLEGILPDSKIGRLLDENYVPQRDAGNISQGIIAFSDAVSGVIEENREEVLSGKAGRNSNFDIPIGLIIFLVWIIFVIIASRMRKNARRAGRNIPWWIPIFLPSGHGSSGGGFSGGGFGGGGFGGGGAGR